MEVTKVTEGGDGGNFQGRDGSDLQGRGSDF